MKRSKHIAMTASMAVAYSASLLVRPIAFVGTSREALYRLR